jgi:hypothetical protein
MGLVGGALVVVVLGLGAIIWLQTGGNGGGAAPPQPGALALQGNQEEPGGKPKQPEASTEPRRPVREPANVPNTDERPPASNHTAESSKPITTAPTRKLQLLVPAYFYPGGPGMSSWQRMMAVASKVQIVAVANPSSGPGEQLDNAYSQIIEVASDKGVKVIGYVNTKYAQRSSGEVKNEIDRWFHLYPAISGFFFDQQSPDAVDVSYYLELRDYARNKIQGKDSLVVTNPGTICAEEYFAKAVSDVTCVFAGPKGFEEFNPPILLKRHYSPSRFAAMPTHVPDAKMMRQVIKDAVLKRIGFVYVSDAMNEDNPWAHLPNYWDDEVDAVRAARMD